MPRCDTIGSCIGTDSNSDIYQCRGTKKYIKWNLDLGKENFEIRSEFKVEKVSSTALSFVLWSGNDMLYIGLDGGGKKLFYEGGSWGKATLLGLTNLKPNTFQTIVIRRTGNVLKIALDENEWNDLPLSESIDAVGWSPWRNTIYVKNLVQIVPKGEKKFVKHVFPASCRICFAETSFHDEFEKLDIFPIFSYLPRSECVAYSAHLRRQRQILFLFK